MKKKQKQIIIGIILTVGIVLSFHFNNPFSIVYSDFSIQGMCSFNALSPYYLASDNKYAESYSVSCQHTSQPCEPLVMSFTIDRPFNVTNWYFSRDYYGCTITNQNSTSVDIDCGTNWCNAHSGGSVIEIITVSDHTPINNCGIEVNYGDSFCSGNNPARCVISYSTQNFELAKFNRCSLPYQCVNGSCVNIVSEPIKPTPNQLQSIIQSIIDFIKNFFTNLFS